MEKLIRTAKQRIIQISVTVAPLHTKEDKWFVLFANEMLANGVITELDKK